MPTSSPQPVYKIWLTQELEDSLTKEAAAALLAKVEQSFAAYWSELGVLPCSGDYVEIEGEPSLSVIRIFSSKAGSHSLDITVVGLPFSED